MSSRRKTRSHLLVGLIVMSFFLPTALALRDEEESVSQKITISSSASPQISFMAQSPTQEQVASQLSLKSRALLQSRYGVNSYIEMNPTTGVLRKLRGVPIAKDLKNVDTLEDKESVLRQFVDENSDLLGVRSAHLALLSQTGKGERSYIAYQQKIGDLPVYGAFIKATLDSQGNLSLLTSSCWPEVKYSTTTVLTEEETARLSAERIVNRKDPDEAPTYKLMSSQKVLFPRYTPEGTVFLISYRQVIHLENPLGDWVTVVDANSGQEYVRYNNYRFATTQGTVQGEILPSYYNDTPQVVPFAGETVHTYAQTPVYSWDLTTDPGWTLEGLWSFGVPNGAGGDGGDNGPTSGHTGSTVLGFNLTGGYPNNMATTQYLTTQAIDCSTLTGTHLAFWRWLGIEVSNSDLVSVDHAYVEVSNNGTDWVRAWSSYAARVTHRWEYCVYDISAIADSRSTVYIRWGVGPTDLSANYAGLYIDDISILAGGGTAVTTASGDFSVVTPSSGTPVIHSKLQGPYADVVNADDQRYRYDQASPSNPADWKWTAPDMTVVQSWNLDTNPGWTMTGSWNYGTPLGAEGDPSQGYTGSSVFGNNLSGAYPNSLTSADYLTTPALDCTGYTGTHLRFWRWLGAESSSYDLAAVQISNDNSNWYTVYKNPSSSFQSTLWQQVMYDISFVADGQPTVFIRWGLGPTDSSLSFSGWNIDDIELLTASVDSGLSVGLYGIDEMNLFYHMEVARRNIKSIDPSFTSLDRQMPGVVRVGTDYANAYYDFTGLNFGEGDGFVFRNLALFSDIIYHEYGHAITHEIYSHDILPYSGEPGALDEAWSDYYACTITNEPMIGEGGGLISQPYLRNLENDLSMPENSLQEVHSDGRIAGAALWAMRELLGKTVADNLFHLARFTLANTFLDYYEALLVTDDTDSDLSNGTPHMLSIATAFGPHGIGGLRIDSLPQEASTEIHPNGKLDAGETGAILPNVTSYFVAEGVQLAAQSGSPYLTFTDNTVAYGNIGYASTVAQVTDTVGVSISSSCPEDEILPVTFTLTAAGGYSSQEIHRLINAYDQILYDEGVSQRSLAYGSVGGGLAVRFTPPSYPVTLTYLRVMPLAATGSDPVPIVVNAWDDDGPGGSPGTPLASGLQTEVPMVGAWFDIPLTFDLREEAYSWNLDTNPGWSMDPGWGYGTPLGQGGDPSMGYSGTSVFGYNLSGTYTNNLASTQYLTTGPIDCSSLAGTRLQFQRWLGVESGRYDHVSIEVSDNGTSWTKVWGNGTATIRDTYWTLQMYDISGVADGQPTVYIRWGLGPTDGSKVYYGWNIDDVAITSKTGTQDGLTITQGDVYVGWRETDTSFYTGVTWKRPDNRSWAYHSDLKQWQTLFSSGLVMDLMMRVRYKVSTGISEWSGY